MFVVAASPTHLSRRSRNLGLGMVILFQPRGLFLEKATGRPISMQARRRIHEKVEKYDGMPIHGDIQVYGDPGNREWKQVSPKSVVTVGSSQSNSVDSCSTFCRMI
jgi:FPC/CPF motif-containing protein YcgG